MSDAPPPDPEDADPMAVLASLARREVDDIAASVDRRSRAKPLTADPGDPMAVLAELAAREVEEIAAQVEAASGGGPAAAPDPQAGRILTLPAASPAAGVPIAGPAVGVPGVWIPSLIAATFAAAAAILVLVAWSPKPEDSEPILHSGSARSSSPWTLAAIVTGLFAVVFLATYLVMRASRRRSRASVLVAVVLAVVLGTSVAFAARILPTGDGDAPLADSPDDAAAALSETTRTTWAVLVGVSDSFRGHLPYAEASVEALAEALQAKAGVPADHIALLTGSDATHDNVREALARVCGRARERDQVIVFVSCHACRHDYGSGDADFLVLHDTEEDALAGTALPFEELASSVHVARQQGRKLIILDTCSAGSFHLPNLLDGAMEPVGLVMACAAGGSAQERGEWGASAVTKALVEALDLRTDRADDVDPDADHDGHLYLDELAAYLRVRVGQLTGNGQEPLVRWRPSGTWDREAFLQPLNSGEPRERIRPLAALVVDSNVPGTVVEDRDGTLIGLADGNPIKGLPAVRGPLVAREPGGRTVEAAVDLRPNAETRIRVEFPDERIESVAVLADGEPPAVEFRPTPIYSAHGIRWSDETGGARGTATSTAVWIDLEMHPWNGAVWTPGGVMGARAGLNVRSLLGLEERTPVALEFWAAGDEGGEQVQVKVGGQLKGAFEDSLKMTAFTDYVRLEKEWTRFRLDLTGKDLSQVVGALSVVADRGHNLGRTHVSFRLDEVRFVRAPQ